jgi:hypothetical protein
MTYLVMGLPPQGASATTPVEDGVYLRMGTYMNDTAHPVNEYARMPKSFRDANKDATASEGIFITSCGTYVIIALDEGHVELENGITTALTGDSGSMTTTVDDGDVTMDVALGSVTLQANSFFDVTSTDGDISVKAEAGKVSTAGNYIYNHTYGTYIASVLANKRSGTHGTDTNVSLSLNISYNGDVSASTNAMIMSVKLASVTATLFSASGGVANMDVNVTARAFLLEDIKVALVYIKYRGIQLETAKFNDETKAMRNRIDTVWIWSALAKAGVAGVGAAYGLTSKIPGP